MGDVWEVVENNELDEWQKEHAASELRRLNSLVFIAKGDQWIPFGPVNGENKVDAEICAAALNAAGR